MYLTFTILLSLLSTPALSYPATDPTTTPAELSKRFQPSFIASFPTKDCSGTPMADQKVNMLDGRCYTFKPAGGSTQIGVNFGSGVNVDHNALRFYTDDKGKVHEGKVLADSYRHEAKEGGMYCSAEFNNARSFKLFSDPDWVCQKHDPSDGMCTD